MLETKSESVKLLKKLSSKTDRTVKYIFLSRNQVLEVSYIDKQDGKDIICVPTQTGCNLGCEFCHLTDQNLQLDVRNLETQEIAATIEYVLDDLGLENKKDKTLLISFMGAGEPLLNIDNIFLRLS